LLYLKKDIY